MGILLAAGGYTAPTPKTGLDFPSNGEVDSDIRLVWKGTEFLDRNDHTVIWKARYVQHTGYYAVTWHSAHTGSWNGVYSFGCHPYPCPGTYDGAGNATNVTGPSGTEHYMEVAGLGSLDRIAIPMEPAVERISDGRWYTHARTCHTDGSDVVHRHYPDILGASSDYIELTVTIASLGSPSDPAFYFGCSDWRENQPSTGRNDECVGGVIRGFRLFSVALSEADLLTEAIAIDNDPNVAASSAGQANTHYINDNPTVANATTDQSAAGNDPVWDNARRPSDWSE